MTSRRSVIAEAPKINTTSQSGAAPPSARATAPTSCGTRSSRDDAGARRRETRRQHAQRLGDDAGLDPRQQGGDDADAQRPERRDANRAAAGRLERRVEGRPGTAKGMIFTVATMSPASTARNGASVAAVIASSTAFTRAIAAASTTTRPALSAKRLTRPVNARSSDKFGPARRSARRRPPRPRRRRPPRAAQRRSRSPRRRQAPPDARASRPGPS